MISTKDLFLLELSTLNKITYNCHGTRNFHLSEDKRYVFAKRNIYRDYEYNDIFTNTSYLKYSYCEVGDECVINSKCLITTKKFITNNEASYILKELNPTYLTEQPKIFKKTK